MDCNLLRILSTFFIAIMFVLPSGNIVKAASVPVTVESNLGGILPFTERNTCDPDFLEVMEARAWEEAQREITQNANIIARPDSVLSCLLYTSDAADE